MHPTKLLKFLSLPAALGLGTALVLACSESSPTSPNQVTQDQVTGTPFAAPKKGHTGGGAVDNQIFGDLNSCPSGYNADTVNNQGSGADDNGDGIVCTKKATKK